MTPFGQNKDPSNYYMRHDYYSPWYGDLFGKEFAKYAGAASGRGVGEAVGSVLGMVECVTDKIVGSFSDRGGLLNDGMRHASSAVREMAGKVAKSKPLQFVVASSIIAAVVGIPAVACWAWSDSGNLRLSSRENIHYVAEGSDSKKKNEDDSR